MSSVIGMIAKSEKPLLFRKMPNLENVVNAASF